MKIAIFTDCKGAFAFGYELDIGGANAAFSQFAGARPKNKNKPSAGIIGGSAGGAKLVFTDYACGDDTPGTILKEIRRLMVQQDADVMVGPLSGDEAVATANWAKSHLDKTIIIGTAASQDPTMQIAPKNVFRYFGDGAQWNAGIGEILYKKWGWRNAAVIMDDYSFAWTSGAGFIADFCAAGGKITKRVFPPLNTTDYSSYVRQLPSPDDVDGYFWVVGGTGTDPAFKAFEQAHGTLKARQHSGNLFLWFLTGASVAPKLRGAYIGGFGIGPGLKTAAAAKYRAVMKRYYPKIPAEDSFTLNYYRSAHALVVGLVKSKGRVGAALQRNAAADHRRSVPALWRRQGRVWTAAARRFRTSTRCRSTRQGRSASPWPATCRTSTRRSAARSGPTSPHRAVPSRPASRGSCRGRARSAKSRTARSRTR